MSEQAFTGFAIGMCMYGLKVVEEIMFGDFVTLIADQLINHASKFVELYNLKLNLVIRAPMGGYRGYGATHSQSLEKIFFGLPNIFIVSPSIAHNPGELLKNSLTVGSPVLFIENKLDYPRDLFESDNFRNIICSNNSLFPIKVININNSSAPELTIVTYGGMLNFALKLQKELFFENENLIRIVVPSLISPVIDESLTNLLINQKKLVLIEEGHGPFSWGDAILSRLYQARYTGSSIVISSDNKIIPASEDLENSVLPSYERISKIVRSFI